MSSLRSKDLKLSNSSCCKDNKQSNGTIKKLLKNVIGISIILFTLSIIPESGYAQIKGKTPEAKQKNAAKLKEKQKEEADENIEKIRKRHMKNQDRKTRKRMKRSAKKAKRNRMGKKEPFWKRIF